MSEPKVVGRQDFLSRASVKPKVFHFDIPGFGRVFYRVFSLAALDALEEDRYDLDQKTGKVKFRTRNARARYLRYAVCDENGVLLFDDDKYIPLLGNLEGPEFDLLIDEIKRANNRTREAEEQIEKNSDSPAVNAGPCSASPDTSA